MFSDTLDAAANSWESAVDMVLAKMPAKINPAMMAKNTPFSEMTCAIRTMMVSVSLPLSCGTILALLSVRPTTPISTAIPIAITTHTDATRRDSFSFFSSSIAIKRSRMCGIPK